MIVSVQDEARLHGEALRLPCAECGRPVADPLDLVHVACERTARADALHAALAGGRVPSPHARVPSLCGRVPSPHASVPSLAPPPAAPSRGGSAFMRRARRHLDRPAERPRPTYEDWERAWTWTERRADGELRGPCPVCDPGRSRTRFGVLPDGRFVCRACHTADYRAVVDRVFGPGAYRGDAAARPAGAPPVRPLRTPSITPAKPASEAQRAAVAAVLAGLVVAEGTPAAAFFARRGTWPPDAGPLPGDVRWHPGAVPHVADWPSGAAGAVVVLMREWASAGNPVTAVGVIPVDGRGERLPFGGDGPKHKCVGRRMCAAFGLGAAGSARLAVLIEGPADALAVWRTVRPAPVVVRAPVATDYRPEHAGGIADDCRVLIVADADRTGRDAARTRRAAWPAPWRRRALLCCPPDAAPGSDADDWLRAAAPLALTRTDPGDLRADLNNALCRAAAAAKERP